MMIPLRRCVGLIVCAVPLSCSSSQSAGEGAGGAAGFGGGFFGGAGTANANGGAMVVPQGSGGMVVVPPAAGGSRPIGSGGAPGAGGFIGVAGMGGVAGGGSCAAGAAGAAGGGAAGMGGTAGASGGGGAAGGGGAGGAGSGTMLTGTLGALGAVKPTVNAWVVSNSGETLIYLSSAPLTCMMMQTMGLGWLPKVQAGAQVIEIVIKGTPTVKTYPVGLLQGEVNYAPGGMSSSYETTATGGSITFTQAMANGPVEGTVMATYAMGSVMGTFHAEFCMNGSQY